MSRSCITDKSEDVEWVEVTTQNLNSLKVDQEVRVNGVQTLITKLDLNDQKNVIGFYTSRGIFSDDSPNNFWGKNSHSPYKVWVKGMKLQAKKDFVVGKWYKCTNSDDGYLSLSVGKYYECKEDSSTRCQIINDVGNLEQYLVHRFDINSESDYDPNASESYPYKHTAYVKFKGYSGEYDSKEYCYKCDHDVIMDWGHKPKGSFSYASVDVNGTIKTVQIQKITKDYLDPKATKCIIGIVEDEKKEFVAVCTGNFFDRLQDHLATNQSGNNATTNVGDVNIMSNQNRVVSVKFFDDDAGLKAENSLVASYEITTRANDAMTVNKLLMREDIAGDIDTHNAVRASTVDATILKNTGNRVFLQPIDFEDLRVVVSNV